MPGKRIVRTLIGHNQVEVGLRCLPSLIHFSSEPVKLLLHDDGTLTDDDCEALIASLSGAEILSRDEADATVVPLLKRHPKCLAYRQRQPLALKLIDMPLIQSEELAYCDSDVLFQTAYGAVLHAGAEDSGDLHAGYSGRVFSSTLAHLSDREGSRTT